MYVAAEKSSGGPVASSEPRERVEIVCRGQKYNGTWPQQRITMIIFYM
jgi:hypothetical protein